MKKPIKPIILLAVLLFLISISTIAALTNNNPPIYLKGEDCVEYHDDIYVKPSLKLNYGGAVKPGEGLEFSISFDITSNGMIFNATTELDNFPDNLTLHEGQSQQIKTDMDSDNFTPTWIISSNAKGNFTFSIKTTISVCYILRHSSYVATYEYRHIGTFEVSDNPLKPPYLLNTVPDQGTYARPINWINVIGQILGFLSIILVYLSIQLGMPDRKIWIRKKMGWSAKQCRETHCDLGYLAMASIVLHNIVLSQTAIWGLYFKWFQFYPTFYIFRDGWSTLAQGLDLAVYGSLLFIIATITGAFFKQIAKKFGYQTAIFSQQISYLAFFLSVIHVLYNGSWGHKFPILLIIQFAMMFEIIISRVIIFYNANTNVNNLKSNQIKNTSDLVNADEQKPIEISDDNENTSSNERS